MKVINKSNNTGVHFEILIEAAVMIIVITIIMTFIFYINHDLVSLTFIITNMIMMLVYIYKGKRHKVDQTLFSLFSQYSAMFFI